MPNYNKSFHVQEEETEALIKLLDSENLVYVYHPCYPFWFSFEHKDYPHAVYLLRILRKEIRRKS